MDSICCHHRGAPVGAAVALGRVGVEVALQHGAHLFGHDAVQPAIEPHGGHERAVVHDVVVIGAHVHIHPVAGGHEQAVLHGEAPIARRGGMGVRVEGEDAVERVGGRKGDGQRGRGPGGHDDVGNLGLVAYAAVHRHAVGAGLEGQVEIAVADEAEGGVAGGAARGDALVGGHRVAVHEVDDHGGGAAVRHGHGQRAGEESVRVAPFAAGVSSPMP